MQNDDQGHAIAAVDQAVRYRRTVWIWVIAIFYMVGTAWTFLSLYLVLSGSIPVNEAQRRYFDSFTLGDYVLLFGTSAINLAGAVSLFLLRKVALYLFLTGFAISVVTTLFEALTTNWTQAIGGGAVGIVLGYAIAIAVCLYVWRLARQGRLR